MNLKLFEKVYLDRMHWTTTTKTQLPTFPRISFGLTFAIGKTEFFSGKYLYSWKLHSIFKPPNGRLSSCTICLLLCRFLHNRSTISLFVWFFSLFRCFGSTYTMRSHTLTTFNALASNPAPSVNSQRAQNNVYMDNANANKDICFLKEVEMIITWAKM